MPDNDVAAQIPAHRAYLLRVAMLQLRNSEAAEDVVQDTLIAALQGAAGFSGRSSVKTWLTGILKHKIVDAIRRKAREPAFAQLDDECQIDDFDALFDASGHWENPPADWGNPENDLSRQQFFDDHAVLPGKAAAEYRAGVHDARSDGTGRRRDL